MKVKKYATKGDKIRDKVTKEYAMFHRNKLKKKKWKKELKQKVIDTLPKRLAVKYNEYNFEDMKKQEITSLYIHGDVGTGKTVDCVYFYVDFIKQLYYKSSLIGASYYFVVFSKLIETLQQDYNNSGTLLQKYMECDLLVIDEFGAKKMTDYVYERIYLIVNERYLSLLPTIINSNFSLAAIGKKFDDERIIRRINEDYILIKKKL